MMKWMLLGGELRNSALCRQANVEEEKEKGDKVGDVRDPYMVVWGSTWREVGNKRTRIFGCENTEESRRTRRTGPVLKVGTTAVLF